MKTHMTNKVKIGRLLNSMALNIASVLLLSVGIVFGQASSISLAVLLVIINIIFSKSYSEVLYIFICLIPFQNYLTFSGISALPVLLFALVIKMLIFRDLTINKTHFLCALTLIMLEIVNDGFEMSLWSLASWSSIALIAIILIDKVNVESIQPWIIVKSFYISIVAAVFCNLLGYSTDTTDSIVTRLGGQYVSLGGAMGLPLYMLLMSSIMIIMYMYMKPTIIQRAFIIISLVIMNFLGLLSVSRAYLLGAGVIVFCLFLGAFTNKGSVALKLILGSLLLILIVVNVKYDVVMQMTSNYEYRFYAHLNDDGRSRIWLSCWEYLNEHLRATVIGNGPLTYQNEGGSGYAFYLITAHNVYIDTIMAFGIIGTFAILNLYQSFFEKCKQTLGSKINIITLMPFLALSAYYLTAGSFRYYKTWFYYIMVIYFSFAANIQARRLYDS